MKLVIRDVQMKISIELILMVYVSWFSSAKGAAPSVVPKCDQRHWVDKAVHKIDLLLSVNREDLDNQIQIKWDSNVTEGNLFLCQGRSTGEEEPVDSLEKERASRLGGKSNNTRVDIALKKGKWHLTSKAQRVIGPALPDPEKDLDGFLQEIEKGNSRRVDLWVGKALSSRELLVVKSIEAKGYTVRICYLTEVPKIRIVLDQGNWYSIDKAGKKLGPPLPDPEEDLDHFLQRIEERDSHRIDLWTSKTPISSPAIVSMAKQLRARGYAIRMRTMGNSLDATVDVDRLWE